MIVAGPKAKALDALWQAIDALRPHLTSSDDRVALSTIEEAAARLAREPSHATAGLLDFDPSRLAHLLQITGPNLAPELLARLTEDLETTSDTLTDGTLAEDWKRLREASHVLISLAGSVGALSLQTMAESLNAHAHRQDREALAPLMPTLQGELRALIQLIRTTRPPQGS